MWDTSKTKRGLEASFFSYGAEGGTRLYPKGEPTGTARACGTQAKQKEAWKPLFSHMVPKVGLEPTCPEDTRF